MSENLDRFNTDYFNDSIMANQFLGSSIPSNFPPNGGTNGGGDHCVWLALSTTMPDQQGNNFTEPSGNGYARVPLTTKSGGQFSVLEASSSVPTNGIFTNNVGVQWPFPTGTWGSGKPIQAMGLFDVSANGNLLAVDCRIIVPTVIGANTPPPFIPPYSLRVGVNAGWGRRGMTSQFAAYGVSSYCFIANSITTPTTYIALCTQIPLPTDTGSTITEPSGNGYSRFATSGNWQKIKPGRYANSTVWNLAYPTGAWGSPPAFAVCNASSAGNILFAGLLNPPPYIDQNNQCPPFLVNGLQVFLGQ
jgi:hypothetical protein